MTVWCVGVLVWTLVLRRPGAGEHVQSVLVCSIIGKMWSSLRLQSHARTFEETRIQCLCGQASLNLCLTELLTVTWTRLGAEESQ